MEGLKRKRRSIKQRQTLFNKYYDEFLNSVSSIPVPEIGKEKIIELEFRLERFEGLLQELEDLQKEIELQLDDNELEAHFNEQSVFENTFFQLLSKCKQFIAEYYAYFTPADQVVPTNHSKSSSSSSKHSKINNHCSNIKLPQISLPKFSGQYKNWLEFRDTFDSLIHSNTSISEIQKYHYLRAALEGGAAQVIRAIEFSSNSYQTAWHTLLERYNNKGLLIQNHVKAILDLPVIVRESAFELRKMLDAVFKHLHSLKILSQPTEHWDTLLVFILSQKLDKLTSREWEQHKVSLEVSYSKNTSEVGLVNKVGGVSLEDFRSFIKSRADFLETLSLSKESNNSRHHTQSHFNIQNSNNITCNKSCIFCKRINHYIQNCFQFSKLASKDRIEQLKNKKICINCLRGLHPLKNCLASHCKKCKEKHNTLLHSDFQILRSSAEQNVSNLPEVETVVSNCAVTSNDTNACFSASSNVISNSKNILLATALVHIRDAQGEFQKVRVLLDSGSQSHFITEDTCKRLGISTFPIKISVQGLNQVTTSNIVQRCSVTFESMHTAYTTSISCLVIPSINEQLPNQIVDISSLNIPYNINLADPSFHVSSSIDLLIGAELFYNLLCIGQIKLGPNSPILQKTVLGWIVSGKIDVPNNASSKTYSNLAILDSNSNIDAFLPQAKNHSLSPEEEECERIFQKTTTRNSDGRFVVKIPFKLDPSLLGDSKDSGKFVICADIVKMYRQILVHNSQLPLQRILWRSNSSDELQTFELCTVTYGTASAPWLAVRCLKQLAIEFAEKFPKACSIIQRDFYMDDLLTSCGSEDEAIQLCNEISYILKAGCFELQKWVSNSQAVLVHVQSTNPNAIFKLGENERTKTLGLYWSYSNDKLMYTIKDSIPFQNSITKRSILSDISQIFDPLGLLGPSVILAKVLLQSLWLLKIQWDESLPSDVDTRWRQFRQQLPVLNSLQVNRHVVDPDATRVELHGFSDASLEAYGACLYIRSISSDGNVTVHLLCAKTKVAPLKSLTVPKLELCGALLLAQLILKVKNAMNLSFNDDSIFLWCDSKVCLAWISTPPSKLQIFVQNRVAQIQELTKPTYWNFIRTSENPADLLSRGVYPQNLLDCELWWNGPCWLTKPQSDWPVFPFHFEGELPECKKQKLAFHTSQKSSWIEIDRYSSLSKLQRVCAYCLRFLHNCNPKNSKSKGYLTVTELANALTRLVLQVQQDSFPNEIQSLKSNKSIDKKSKLLSLNPFLDTKGTLRVGGRLQYSNLSYDVKHPVILPGRHHLTKLIFRSEHIRLSHAGPQQLLFSVREQYWCLGGKNIAKQTVHNCVRCYICRPVPHSLLMGPLPKHRVTVAPPFSATGVDYFGPVYIKNKRGRGATSTKAWVSLFICFVTKAVHLELVPDLTKDAFIAAFRRFCARRGKPSNVYSDNGTNFVSANSEIKELSNFLKIHLNELQESAANIGVNWHFIPSYSPHFGGLWEAGVKSAKYHLVRIIGNNRFTYEEFTTILCGVESILNSRPITPLSPDPSDPSALTPSHFLIGRSATSLPDPDVKDIPISRLSRYQLLQQVQQHFWARWTKEYISELQLRTKWKTSQLEIKLGSLVVLKDDHLPPLRWKLGRVIALHPGLDGISRVASIKTTGGVVKRAFARFCALPIETNTLDAA